MQRTPINSPPDFLVGTTGGPESRILIYVGESPDMGLGFGSATKHGLGKCGRCQIPCSDPLSTREDRLGH
jgi:hypothetical protein